MSKEIGNKIGCENGMNLVAQRKGGAIQSHDRFNNSPSHLTVQNISQGGADV